MRYNLPTFPLVINVWHAPHTMTDPPDLTIPAELVVRVQSRLQASTATVDQQNLHRFIYVAKGTDLRGAWTAGGPDLVECPAGSGRTYGIIDVDDVAKGRANEFRIASVSVTLHPVGGPTNWPIPMP